MMTIIVEASKSLYEFLMVLYIMVTIFGICNFIVNEDIRIEHSLAASYQTMFGENLEDMHLANGPQ
jgi:hypothetical protein